MRLGPYLALLRHNPDFSRLFGAQLISFGGDWFATVAILGLCLELTGSPAVASLVLVIQTGAFAIASPLAGALADRFDRRRLIVAADLLRVPVALAFLLVGEPGTLWIAFTAMALLSFGAAVFEPTSSASLPNLVEPEELGEANVLIGSAWGTMLAVGAAIGGLVATVFGREVTFVLNAASFAASAALILGIRRPFRRPSPATEHRHALPHRDLRGMVEWLAVVVRFARGNRTVAALLLAKTTFGVGTGAVLMLAVFGDEVYGAGEAGIGLMFAARGLGALIGPFLARSTTGLNDRGLLVGIAVSFAAYAVGYSLLPLAPWLALAALFVFVAHLGGGAQWMLSSYGLQRAAPDDIRGRVFSFDYGLVTLTIAISTLLTGLLAEQLPPALATWAVVALAAIAALGWLVLARPALRSGAPVAAGRR
jgi:MFS family permease